MTGMFKRISFGNVWTDEINFLQRRHLRFSGAKNFRDLGGYPAADGRTVRWGVLYRSDALDKLNDRDLKLLLQLNLDRVIDFRSEHEKKKHPDCLPAGAGIRIVEIPISDTSTRVWHEARDEMIQKLRDINPADYMISTNVELATRFTPEMRRFVREVLASDGRPVLFHCAAGKDRTGFGAAILLRMLGVPQEVIMQDYQLTNVYLLKAYRWRMSLVRVLKGRRFVSAILGFMDANTAYLSAAFDAVEREHGSFDVYIRDGLGVEWDQFERFRETCLELRS
jgi:protein-tyrosine phosphatase